LAEKGRARRSYSGLIHPNKRREDDSSIFDMLRRQQHTWREKCRDLGLKKEIGGEMGNLPHIVLL
jgi:hypothetical protein